ncbi:5-amino-6-(D-ribitylamino)uracil--L-tyrosine 4-hydroxyphenyl transferase CofH [Pseudohaliea sp.]|uniref:5-amino-6-(D-ribitylamino)uracil--L-tyrosine 4-hydroxyphenyl transferase CofH n=1 Tax=Pseudohaliea sp. TaxID=2740289 RepID=UPI0032EBBD53
MKGGMLDDFEALALAGCRDVDALCDMAARLRDLEHGEVVTYSRKVFLPLTRLCRDVCHYCTFATTPGRLESAFMSLDEVLSLCHEGAKLGCKEALFTLGERPELRYRAAREALTAMGFSTTLEYVAAVAARVRDETGLLPHINAGCMSDEELAALRPVSASMGLMLESVAERLCEKGQAHHGSPDKEPARRLATLEAAGRARVPFTSGILVGIGETRRERIEALLALRASHQRHGHLQEVIIQNFRAKAGTLMAAAPEPDLAEVCWSVAVARLILGPAMNIQVPPNLSPGSLPQLIAAGINDWGGVSPLTPDHVNPEAPWPHLDELAKETWAAGKFLEQRLTVYPSYARQPERWLDERLRSRVLRLSDAAGFARRDGWVPGRSQTVPADLPQPNRRSTAAVPLSGGFTDIIRRCEAGAELQEKDLCRLFAARGREFNCLAKAADRLREAVNGDVVTYVVNRNINYTNVCYFNCQFCAFSKGQGSSDLRGRPYDIDGEEIARRCVEAWERGATEVCMQGGIHPDYSGDTYLQILRTARAAVPGMHIHAFSPLEVTQGANTLGLSVEEFLGLLRDEGLGSLPGTAAEVLHEEVRRRLCPDKISGDQWLDVMRTAHTVGLPTTATIMYGHIERPRHWADHLLKVRRLQAETGGFTEFVPLPFVAEEAPIYRRGLARPGPTFREAILMHAVARLVLHGYIDNIQASWVKMGQEGVAACLAAGANDLGGTLMNESITRAAGAAHGQEWSARAMEQFIRELGRRPRQRNTRYEAVPPEQRMAASACAPLQPTREQAAGRKQVCKLVGWEGQATASGGGLR